jgi:phage FluMu gp28-like protein
MSTTDTPHRSEFAPDRPDPIPADADRQHGTGVPDPATLSDDAFKEWLATGTRAERMELLFGFRPYDYQRDLVDHVDSHTVARVAIKPGRQVGKTLTCAAIGADAVAAAPGMEGEDILLAAPFQETADEMMREAKRFLREAARRLDAVGLDLGCPPDERNKREWEFVHGGRLLSRTLGVDGVGQRGKNPKVVIVDEAAYAPDTVFEDVLEPFFLTHESYVFIIVSTPAGESGYYHEKVVVDDDWHSPYWPSVLNPQVDPAWLAEKREKTESRTFRQEYLGQFIGSSDRFFQPQLIDDATDADVEATFRPRDMVLGADIARAGDDRTVIVGVDTNGIAKVLTSDNDMTLTDAAGALNQLHDAHDVSAIRIDETGLGAGVVEMLENRLGSRLVTGTKFTLDRKQSLYNELKADLEGGDLTLCPHTRLRRELKKLQYSLTAGGKTKISHPDNGFDDHPDALVLAADAHREAQAGVSAETGFAFELT